MRGGGTRSKGLIFFSFLFHNSIVSFQNEITTGKELEGGGGTCSDGVESFFSFLFRTSIISF